MGLADVKSLRDPSGNLDVNHPDDPAAFGTAAGYVVTGHDAIGLFRAAVEVATAVGPAAGPNVAETLLRTRVAAGITYKDRWWDNAFWRSSMLRWLPSRSAPVSAPNGSTASPIWPTPRSSAVSAATTASRPASWVGEVNPHPDAADIYARSWPRPPGHAPDQDARIGRFHLEQGWLKLPEPARLPPLDAFLDMLPPGMTARVLQDRLDMGRSAHHSAALFPAGAPTTPGRIRGWRWHGCSPTPPTSTSSRGWTRRCSPHRRGLSCPRW